MDDPIVYSSDDPVQQVVVRASDFLASLALDEIVGDRIAMKAEVRDESEYVNSKLEVMDLAINELFERNPLRFREIAERFLVEPDSDIRDTGIRMLFKALVKDGDAETRKTIEKALVANYTHAEAVSLMLDTLPNGPRALVEIMISLVLIYNGDKSP